MILGSTSFSTIPPPTILPTIVPSVETTHLFTTQCSNDQCSNAELKEKISKLESMTDAIDDVTETIDSVTSRRQTKSLSCSAFIDLLEKFESIADQTSKLDRILSISDNIKSNSNNIESCSTSQISLLSTIKSSLEAIKEQLEETIQKLQNMLSATTVPGTNQNHCSNQVLPLKNQSQVSIGKL